MVSRKHTTLDEGGEPLSIRGEYGINEDRLNGTIIDHMCIRVGERRCSAKVTQYGNVLNNSDAVKKLRYRRNGSRSPAICDRELRLYHTV